MGSASDLNGSRTAPAGPSRGTSAPSDWTGCPRPVGFPGLPAGWKADWETFPSSDGAVQLFATTYARASGGGSRALLVLHGFGEHGGRYQHVPHFLKEAVDHVMVLDHRGHGRSEGLRGHLERFDQLADDAAHALRRLRERVERLAGPSELHLLGHSLGGHVALRALFAHPDLPLRSVTLCAPFLGIRAKVPLAKKAAAFALSRLWGSLQIDAGVDVGALSHDRSVCEGYAADRLVHSKMTPRFFMEMRAAMADTLRRQEGVAAPLQILVPLQDALADPDVTLRFFRDLKHREKRLRTYSGFFHEPLNEIGKEQVFEDVADWIRSHGGAGT